MVKVAFTDCTGLFMDEAKEIAKNLGLSEAYAEADFLDSREIRKYIRCLNGKSIDEVNNWMVAEPFHEALNVTRALKSSDYEIHVVSDSPLLMLPAAYTKLYRIGIDFIHQTIRPDINGGYFTGYLNSYKPKSEVVMEVVKKKQPKKILGIGHARNDTEMLEIIENLGGTTIAVGNGLNAHYKVKDLSELTRLIPRLR